MLKQRQNNLLLYLKNAKRPVKSEELASFFGVSARTIRNDINAIDEVYPNQIIASQNGYYLNGQLTILEPSEDAVLPKQRQRFIVKESLLHPWIDIEDVSEKLYISSQTLINDFKTAQCWLSNYGLTFQRCKNKYALIGDEQSKRKLFRTLLEEEVTGNFLNTDKIAELFHDFDMNFVIETFQNIIEEENFVFNGVAYHMVLIHIGIAISRMIDGNYTDHHDIKLNSNSQEYRIAMRFFASIKDQLGIDISEDEVANLYLLLIGSKSYHETETLSDDIESFCVSAIDSLNQEFSLDLVCDDELIIGLALHIRSLLQRQKHDVSIRNILLSDIKNNYPLTFEMSIRFSELLKKQYQISINDNEIGFIALHIGVSYERQRKKHVYQTLMIYPYNSSLVRLLKQRIEQEFGQRLNIVMTDDCFDPAKHSWAQLVITTIPLTLDVPHVVISSALNEHDQDALSQAIQRLDKQEKRKMIVSSIMRFFDPGLFIIDTESQTPQEVIGKLSSLLLEKDYVDESYLPSVLQREAISPTSFEQFFAVPHSMTLNAKQTKVAVAILHRPVQWGDYTVKLVLQFALAPEHRKLLKTLYDLINDVLCDKDNFEQLIAASDYNEFIRVLFQPSSFRS